MSLFIRNLANILNRTTMCNDSGVLYAMLTIKSTANDVREHSHCSHNSLDWLCIDKCYSIDGVLICEDLQTPFEPQLFMEICDTEQVRMMAPVYTIHAITGGENRHNPLLVQRSATTYWNITDVTETIVRRDRAAASEFMPKIIAYYADLRARTHARDQEQAAFDNADMVSASSTRNFMLDDCTADVMRYRETGGLTFTDSQRALFKRGNEFEDSVVSAIASRFAPHMVKITESINARRVEFHHNTITEMSNGVPIIYQGIVHDSVAGCFGAVDLLVRSDWLNKIFTEQVIEDADAAVGCRFNPSWHYRVIDIKLSKVYLRADGIHLGNGHNAKATKAQLYVYLRAVGRIQGYDSHVAYVIGAGWHCMKKRRKMGGADPLDRVGRIDFTPPCGAQVQGSRGRAVITNLSQMVDVDMDGMAAEAGGDAMCDAAGDDAGMADAGDGADDADPAADVGTVAGPDHSLIPKIEEAIKWVRNVRSNAHSWDITKPHLECLYPNMKKQSGDLSAITAKQSIAEDLHEITCVWMCGIKQRRKAFAHGIYSWSDARLTAELMGFKGRRAIVINAILLVNRSGLRSGRSAHGSRSTGAAATELITHTPATIPASTLPSAAGLSFIVRFEMLNIYEKYTYMVGVTTLFDDQYIEYKCFTVPETSLACELANMAKFVEYVQEVRSAYNSKHNCEVPYVIYHWSIFERATVTMFLEKHNIAQADASILAGDKWVAIVPRLHRAGLAIRGAFKFGMKEICEATRENRLTATTHRRAAVRCESVRVAQTDTRVVRSTKTNAFRCAMLVEVYDFIRSISRDAVEELAEHVDALDVAESLAPAMAPATSSDDDVDYDAVEDEQSCVGYISDESGWNSDGVESDESEFDMGSSDDDAVMSEIDRGVMGTVFTSSGRRRSARLAGA